MRKAGTALLVLLAHIALGQKSVENVERIESVKSVRDGQEVVLKKFEKAAAVYQESIFCHLNKQVFLPGETLWMQAYVINTRDKTPAMLTANVIAEITDKTGRTLSRKIFFAEEGTAPGQFELNNFVPGDYFVKVYTSWMRNFGQAYYAVQPITILPPKPVANRAAIPAVFSVHPEGGHLLADTEQKLVVVADRPEQQIVSGKIKTSTGTMVQQFVVNPGEIPSFYLTPIAGQSYIAELSLLDGKTVKTEIPPVSATGIGIALNPYFRNKVRVSLSSNTPQAEQQDYLVLVHAAGKLHKALKVKLSAPQTTFELNQQELAAGVNTLTVFTAQGLPVTERAFFVPVGQRKGQLDVSLLPRKNDSLQLQLRLPQNADRLKYSVSVLPAATLAWNDRQSLYSFAFLDDQLTAHAYAAAPMTTSGSFTDLNNIDHLLIAFGGRKFNWDWVAGLSENPFKHEFERGFSIKGALAGEQQKKDKGQIALYSAENHLMLNSKADSLGRFTFERLFLLDSTKLSLTLETAKGHKTMATLTAVQVPSAEEEPLQKKELPAVLNPDHNLTAFNFGSLLRPVKNVTLKEVNIVSSKKPAKSPGIYQKGINDDSFVVDESTVKRFNTLIDLLRGKFMLDINDMGAGEIQVKMRGGMLGLNASGNVQSRNPVIVIDGMIVNDMNYLRDLNIFDLEEVAVNKTGINLLGPSGSNGAIFIKTRTSPIDFSRVNELDPSDKVIQWIVARGYTEARKFSAPLYNLAANAAQLQSILPVFWQTGNLAKENNDVLSFKLPFPCKELILIIEGLGKDGLLYSERKKIQIP